MHSDEALMLFRPAAGVFVAAFLAQGAFAQTLGAPSGEVLLTVSGDIAVTNGEGTAVFDRAMLEALPVVEFTTTTTWTDGPQTFTGVELHDLLERLGVEGGTLRAFAVNDYAVDIPVEDAVEGGPIVAYLWNGAAMSVRDKGPLWIVYPYDSNRDYRSEVIYSRSIWQLERMEVRP
jgi:hypothetical protein